MLNKRRFTPPTTLKGKHKKPDVTIAKVFSIGRFEITFSIKHGSSDPVNNKKKLH